MKKIFLFALLFSAIVSNAQLRSNGTGTSSPVYSNSPTLVTPALGTPSSLVGTNITGTASGFTAGNVTTNANLTGDVTSSGNATTYNSVVPTTKGGAGTVNGILKANGSGTVSAAGETTVGNNLLTLTNPSAIRYLKINADNTVTARTAAEMLGDIGAQTFAQVLGISVTIN